MAPTVTITCPADLQNLLTAGLPLRGLKNIIIDAQDDADSMPANLADLITLITQGHRSPPTVTLCNAPWPSPAIAFPVASLLLELLKGSHARATHLRVNLPDHSYDGPLTRSMKIRLISTDPLVNHDDDILLVTRWVESATQRTLPNDNWLVKATAGSKERAVFWETCVVKERWEISLGWSG
ncbi:hypothetical protein L202_06660 [Cryptococcus amylolentus CBS 6039]|uniref:Uncharacterized protein n=2 Tax=Cryptococcus amylolentus TaxID=104669 RepID=A0A1E3HHD3_9TREE|nr:hypothetical protein L202_06660 [Cryptococcus amylolentus CBS 6039]ODN75535.1 hypothetical protein L202_06660 [Cryptococcus amylolentus CBS 6039]ODO03241.1 hypothetical protein I350_06086 [Cryptococcus amylolentus CBS 6273]